MRIVRIENPLEQGKEISFVCRWEKTRTGFRHCVETEDGIKKNASYLNRTWECYQYQTALHRCIEEWLKCRTGLNPRTKRDKARFDELYHSMCSAVDEKSM